MFLLPSTNKGSGGTAYESNCLSFEIMHSHLVVSHCKPDHHLTDYPSKCCPDMLYINTVFVMYRYMSGAF